MMAIALESYNGSGQDEGDSDTRKCDEDTEMLKLRPTSCIISLSACFITEFPLSLSSEPECPFSSFNWFILNQSSGPPFRKVQKPSLVLFLYICYTDSSLQSRKIGSDPSSGRYLDRF